MLICLFNYLSSSAVNDILQDRIERLRSIHPHVRFIAGNAAKTDLPRESFGQVFESTMFVQTTKNGLVKSTADEFMRVLKPGGVTYC